MVSDKKVTDPVYRNRFTVQAISIAIAPRAALQRPDRYGSFTIELAGIGATGRDAPPSDIFF